MITSIRPYEYPPIEGGHCVALVHSDDFLFSICYNYELQFHLLRILHKPFNRWLRSVPIPDLPDNGYIHQCFGVDDSPRSFIVLFKATDTQMCSLMYYALLPSNDGLLLQVATPLIRAENLNGFHVIVQGDCCYVVHGQIVYKMDMHQDDAIIEIGRLPRTPSLVLLSNGTMYAVHLENENRRLVVHSFDIATRRSSGSRRILFDSPCEMFPSVCSHPSILLVASQSFIGVMRPATSGGQLVFHRIPVPLFLLHTFVDAEQSLQFELLANGELVVCTYRLADRPCTTRLRTVAFLEPPSLAELALRSVHSILPTKTKQALEDCALGDVMSLVGYLCYDTLRKPAGKMEDTNMATNISYRLDIIPRKLKLIFRPVVVTVIILFVLLLCIYSMA